MPREPAKRDEAFLIDIDDAAASALRYCAGLTLESFIANEMVQDATLYAILVIGEATKHVSKEFRAGHPDIPWQGMAGMRDRMIHGYDQIDMEAVWDVVSIHLPALRTKLAPLLPRRE